MKRWPWVLAIAMGTAGCASTPKLKGLWYLQETAGNEEPRLYVALVNRDKAQVNIRSLSLNRASDGQGGWKLVFTPAQTLEPGGIYVQRAVKFLRKDEAWPARCRVPLEIAVEVDTGSFVAVDMDGLMPSALPNTWEDCPLLSPGR